VQGFPEIWLSRSSLSSPNEIFERQISPFGSSTLVTGRYTTPHSFQMLQV
jgi:hypothetical protein